MGKWLKRAKRLLDQRKEKEENNPKNQKLYIDDGLFWWAGGEIKLLEFLNFLNNLHPNIKITWSYDFKTKSVNYLHVVVFMDEEGYIQTDLYVKPNTKNNYLLASSSHPAHIFCNMPYSLAQRLVRNCSQKPLLDKRLGDLRELLLGRGYRKGVINSALEKARGLKRSETLKKVERDRGGAARVKFVIEYDPRLPKISEILKRQ